MNWKQLYLSATPEERLETALLMLRAVEERQRRLVFVPPLSINALLMGRGRGWGLVREKRGPFPAAHFLNDRRRLRRSLPRIITLLSYTFILSTVSVATWLFALVAPTHQLAIPTLGLHLVGLTAVLVIKPYRLKTHLARSE